MKMVELKIDNTTMAKLKPMPSGNGYKAITLKDKTLMGFRARVSETGKRVLYLDTDLKENLLVVRQMVAINIKLIKPLVHGLIRTRPKKRTK